MLAVPGVVDAYLLAASTQNGKSGEIPRGAPTGVGRPPCVQGVGGNVLRCCDDRTCFVLAPILLVQSQMHNQSNNLRFKCAWRHFPEHGFLNCGILSVPGRGFVKAISWDCLRGCHLDRPKPSKSWTTSVAGPEVPHHIGARYPRLEFLLVGCRLYPRIRTESRRIHTILCGAWV